MMSFEEFRKKYDIQLNKEQLQAVSDTDGHIILLAVPGSGKTTVIVARTGYLLKCKEVNPKSILVVTYSKAAAIEMKERFQRKFPDIEILPRFSTIHSFCVNVIRYAASKIGITIPELVTDVPKIIRTIIYQETRVWASEALIKAIVTTITKVKNRMLSNPEIVAIKIQEFQGECPSLNFEKVFRLYEQYKTKNNIMDFDDQLTMANDILTRYPSVRSYFVKMYPYIQMDETQDTSRIQYVIIKQIASQNNLFIVGDDDQSIYGFRGAEPSNMLHFTDDYPDAKVIRMETNYRCAETIVTSANRFISFNRERYKKEIRANRKEHGDIKIRTVTNEVHMYNVLIQSIAKYTKEANQTLAVIARNNYIFLPLVILLDKFGISVRRRDNFEAYFGNSAINLIISILELSQDTSNLQAFIKAKSALKLFLKKSYTDQIVRLHKESVNDGEAMDVFDIAETVCANDQRILFNVREARRLVEKVKMMTPKDAIHFITSNFAISKNNADDDFLKKLNTSLLYLGTIEYIASLYENIPTFLSEMEHYRNSKEDHRSVQSCVTLTTIHSAKGLEFDKVILLEAIDGILPMTDPDDNKTPAEMEEDARLFYVAITRAKDDVEIMLPNKLYECGNISPSPFIERLLNDQYQLPTPAIKQRTSGQETSDFKIGTKVKHSKYGVGFIREVKETTYLVLFTTGTYRELLKEYCTKIL